MDEGTPITYRDAVRLDRPDALILGVSGQDAAAAAQRLEVAIAIRDEHHRVLDAAYGQAQGTSREPNIPPSFGMYAIIASGGDLNAVVDGPDFEDLVLDDLGLGYEEYAVSDEDGDRYEVHQPGPGDRETARQEVARIREALVARGVVADRPAVATQLVQQAFPSRTSPTAPGRDGQVTGPPARDVPRDLHRPGREPGSAQSR